MSSIDETVLFKFNEKDEKTVQETLTIVYDALNEKGYSSINQIVGYLLSGDPAYMVRDREEITI